MPENNGWLRLMPTGGGAGAETNQHDETPPIEALAPRRRSDTTLRLIYNRDAETGVLNNDVQDDMSNMEPREPLQDSNRHEGMLDRGLQAKIGRMLREVFADVAQEPVPERLIKLLEALETKEKGR